MRLRLRLWRWLWYWLRLLDDGITGKQYLRIWRDPAIVSLFPADEMDLVLLAARYIESLRDNFRCVPGPKIFHLTSLADAPLQRRHGRSRRRALCLHTLAKHRSARGRQSREAQHRASHRVALARPRAGRRSDAVGRQRPEISSGWGVQHLAALLRAPCTVDVQAACLTAEC